MCLLFQMACQPILVGKECSSCSVLWNCLTTAVYVCQCVCEACVRLCVSVCCTLSLVSIFIAPGASYRLVQMSKDQRRCTTVIDMFLLTYLEAELNAVCVISMCVSLSLSVTCTRHAPSLRLPLPSLPNQPGPLPGRRRRGTLLCGASAHPSSEHPLQPGTILPGE